MKRTTLLICFTLFLSTLLEAKTSDGLYSISAHQWVTSNMKGQSIMLTKYWKRKVFRVPMHLGFGMAIMRNHLNYQNYITAPSMLLKGGNGPLYWFKPNLEENMDTLMAGQHTHYYLNLFFHWDFPFRKYWRFEAESDIIGFSFGEREQGLLSYGDAGDFFKVYTTASPTGMNFQLPGAGKVGSCQLRAFVSYSLSDHFRIGVGAMHQVSEFMTLQAINYINSRNVNINTGRYRSASNGIVFQATYKF